MFDEGKPLRYNFIAMKKLIKKTLKLEKPSLVQDEIYYEWFDDDEKDVTKEIRIDDPNK